MFAALAKNPAGGEIGPVAGRPDGTSDPLEAYVRESCVACHNATRKDGEVDLSGAISTDLWRRAAREMAKGTMPRRGRKAPPDLIDAALDRAFER